MIILSLGQGNPSVMLKRSSQSRLLLLLDAWFGRTSTQASRTLLLACADRQITGEVTGVMMEAALQRLLNYIAERTGMRLTDDRASSLADGVDRAMAQAGVRDVESFLSRIKSDHAAFDDLVAEVTIGETYFNREPEQFAALREIVIPDIQARKGQSHLIRFWSAACSTGEEPWSLAMMCRQAGLLEHCRILATDISRASLQTAERGEYRQWSVRSKSLDFAGSMLQKTERGWRVSDSLRRHVVFEYLNLALDNYPSLASGTWGCDVILCRNVLIYFDRPTVELVVRRLYESLTPGGWLVLASTDPSPMQIAPFKLVQAGGCLLYQRPVESPGAAGTGVNHSHTGHSHTDHSNVGHPVDDESDDWVFETGKAQPADSMMLRTPDPVSAEAQEALKQGDYQRVRELTENRPDDPVACALHVRALAGLDTAAAERACAQAVEKHSTNDELHYLHSVLLVDLNRYIEAEQAVRRALFLDSDLAIGHFTLGVILQHANNRSGARRAFTNCQRICERQPASALIRLSDGEHAGRLAQVASRHITMLEARPSQPD